MLARTDGLHGTASTRVQGYSATCSKKSQEYRRHVGHRATRTSTCSSELDISYLILQGH